MKRFILVLAFMFLFSAVGFASPLTDFSQGKGALDITLRPSSNLDFEGESLDGTSSNFDLGLTLGLGNNFAFQWQNQTAKSKTYSGTLSDGVNTATGSMNTKLTANQFNILYKLEKNFIAFVGYTQAKNEMPISGTINGLPANETIGGKTVNGYQIGLIGTFPMGDQLTGYGTIGFGNKIENFEFGVSYELSKNAELNVAYKSIKYKDLLFDVPDADKYDLKVNGLAAGITFKF